MSRNNHSKVKSEKNLLIQVYQYNDGEFLPNSSQPNLSGDYEITSKMCIPHKSTRYINVFIGENGMPQKLDITGNLIETDKALPDLYSKRECCCGCTACYSICPFSAIIMRPDEEGFLYPVVNAEKCQRCYKCLSVCIFKERQKEKGYID